MSDLMFYHAPCNRHEECWPKRATGCCTCSSSTYDLRKRHQGVLDENARRLAAEQANPQALSNTLPEWMTPEKVARNIEREMKYLRDSLKLHGRDERIVEVCAGAAVVRISPKDSYYTSPPWASSGGAYQQRKEVSTHIWTFRSWDLELRMESSWEECKYEAHSIRPPTYASRPRYDMQRISLLLDDQASDDSLLTIASMDLDGLRPEEPTRPNRYLNGQYWGPLHHNFLPWIESETRKNKESEKEKARRLMDEEEARANGAAARWLARHAR